MKIKDIALSAAYVGQMVVKAICVGAQEIWSAVKYIVFKDPVVEQICVANFSSDGVGVTEEDAAKVTSIGTIFKGNMEITSFDELKHFTSVKTLSYQSFYACSNLVSVDLPSSITRLEGKAFANNTKLEHVGSLANVTDIGSACFESTPNLRIPLYCPLVKNLYGSFTSSGLIKADFPNATSSMGATFANCQNLQEMLAPNLTRVESSFCENTPSLKKADISSASWIGDRVFYGATSLTDVLVDFSNITFIGRLAFSGVPYDIGSVDFSSLENVTGAAFSMANIRRIESLGSVVQLLHSNTKYGYGGVFSDNPNLEYVNIPDTMTTMYSSFRNCPKLETVICNAITPPTINKEVFMETPMATGTGYIYVPDQSVQAYREASGWSAYADKIKPLSQYVEQ